jgi:hypothetical protein
MAGDAINALQISRAITCLTLAIRSIRAGNANNEGEALIRFALRKEAPALDEGAGVASRGGHVRRRALRASR